MVTVVAKMAIYSVLHSKRQCGMFIELWIYRWICA